MLIIIVLLISVIITYLMRIRDVKSTFTDYHESLSLNKSTYIWWKVMTTKPLTGHFTHQISIIASLYHQLNQIESHDDDPFPNQIRAIIPIAQAILMDIK